MPLEFLEGGIFIAFIVSKPFNVDVWHLRDGVFLVRMKGTGRVLDKSICHDGLKIEMLQDKRRSVFQ